MKNIARELDLDSFDDEDYPIIERFGRKPSFKDESYRRERKGDSIRRKRQQKEREREQMAKDFELDSE